MSRRLSYKFSSGSRRRNAARLSGLNLRLEIEYDGTNYCGWQIQKSQKSEVKGHKSQVTSHKLKSIQGTIEKALQKILQEKVRLIASGRTDAGVHALSQVANFRTKSAIPLNKLQRALNGLLPEDIVITKIEEAAPDFHSRFKAKAKVYRYTILNRPYPSAFLRRRAYFYPQPLDLKLMQKESRTLLGRHNFSSFQAAGNKERNSFRTIKKIKIARKGSLIYIDIEADGFLQHMVRSIIGTLIEIGRHRFAAGSLKKILFSRQRKLAGPTAAAKGLCLIKVEY